MATEQKETDKPAEIDMKALFSEEKPTEKPAAKTDDKSADAPSSGEAAPGTPEELKAQVEALTKELSRVRKGKAESSNEVQELREQLAEVQGHLKGLSSKGSTGTETEENRLAKYTDEQLIQGQTEWEDSAYDAREAMRRARTENDEEAFAKASRNVGIAKTTLNAIRKELLERTKRVGAEQARAQSENEALVTEISGIYERAYEAFPGLKDKESDLWQAGNEVFNKHPKLMKSLGPLAEFVATSMAIAENPKLIGTGDKGDTKARKELLKEINERAEESLIKGKGTPSKKTVPDFGAMSSQEFDQLVHKLKMGG